jgi:ketosteroid isomerase-like protein
MISLGRASARHSSIFRYWMVIVCAAGCATCWGAPNDEGTKSEMASAAPAHKPGANQIRVLISQYAQAVDAADTQLASRIWSHSPEVSFIHPLGQDHGLEQIEQDVYVHLMGETFSERHLQFHDITVHVYGDAAWAELYWDFQAKLRKDGSAFTSHGRETQIYHKEKDGWRLVHVHYSPRPAAGEGQGS